MSNKIKPEIIDILNRGRIETDKYFLPENLDRKVYQECNLHLTNCGGKWDRRSKCHLFPKSTDKLKSSLAVGATVNERQEYQAFYTPDWLAAKVVQHGDVSGKTVLEPSAGIGNIAKEIIVAGALTLTLVELNPESVETLKRARVYGNIYQSDFLEWNPGRQYERIIANPPFTKGQWLKHLFKAWDLLAVGGILVFICPNSPNDMKLANFLYGKQYAIFEVEDGAFKESGTMVKTIILRVVK